MSDCSLLQFEIIASIKLLATIKKKSKQEGRVNFAFSELSES